MPANGKTAKRIVVVALAAFCGSGSPNARGNNWLFYAILIECYDGFSSEEWPGCGRKEMGVAARWVVLIRSRW